MRIIFKFLFLGRLIRTLGSRLEIHQRAVYIRTQPRQKTTIDAPARSGIFIVTSRPFGRHSANEHQLGVAAPPARQVETLIGENRPQPLLQPAHTTGERVSIEGLGAWRLQACGWSAEGAWRCRATKASQSPQEQTDVLGVGRFLASACGKYSRRPKTTSPGNACPHRTR